MIFFFFSLKYFQLLFSKCDCERVEDAFLGFEVSTFLRSFVSGCVWLFADDINKT